MRGCAGLAIALCAGTATAEPALSHVRSVTLQSDLPDFGGLSAIETTDGTSFVVLSDRGQAYDLTFDRGQNAVRIAPRPQPAPDRDSEGLAYAGDDLFYSYEGPAELRDARGTLSPRDPAFDSWSINSGFEALAAAPDGTLFAVPERSGGKSQPFPVFRLRNGTWDIARTFPRTGAFLPVGADIGPDGMLYVLERAFSALGFRSRIRRMAPDSDGEVETLLTTRLGLHDNLEGITVWTARTGQVCVTMVSDNNFLSVQRTEIVEYSLSAPLAAGRGCD
ncbi:MAG: esterase-like activity of phytase family protein [Pseudomonadota bacterium]